MAQSLSFWSLGNISGPINQELCCMRLRLIEGYRQRQCSSTASVFLDSRASHLVTKMRSGFNHGFFKKFTHLVKSMGRYLTRIRSHKGERSFSKSCERMKFIKKGNSYINCMYQWTSSSFSHY